MPCPPTMIASKGRVGVAHEKYCGDGPEQEGRYVTRNAGSFLFVAPCKTETAIG